MQVNFQSVQSYAAQSQAAGQPVRVQHAAPPTAQMPSIRFGELTGLSDPDLRIVGSKVAHPVAGTIEQIGRWVGTLTVHRPGMSPKKYEEDPSENRHYIRVRIPAQIAENYGLPIETDFLVTEAQTNRFYQGQSVILKAKQLPPSASNLWNGFGLGKPTYELQMTTDMLER